MFPVIWYFLFGSWFKSQLGSLVTAAKGLYLDIFCNWKNCHNGQYFPDWNALSMFVVPISRGISVTYLDIFWIWKNCHNGQNFPDWNTLSMFVVPISRGISVTYLDIVWIWKNCPIRRRGALIVNIMPGPRPRTEFGGGDVEHCLLLWWYTVGADQATKVHVWHLIFHSQCVGNGKRRRLVCPPSCGN